MGAGTAHNLFKKKVTEQVDSTAALEWKARLLAKGLHLGKHQSSKIGVGMEFNQFRNYVQGDDIRLLDWKMYAKTQQYFIRQSDIETNHSLHITIDNSTSMEYAEGGISKIDLAKMIAATLTYVMAQQADQFGWSSGREVFRKSQGLKNWRRSVIELDSLQTDERSNKEKYPTEAAGLRMMSKSTTGIHLWVTDLYMDVEAFEKFLSVQNHPNNELVIFHLIGRKEETLDFDSNTKFVDLESGEDMQVNAQKFRATYQASFGQHIHRIKRICQNKQVVYRKVYLDADLKNEMRAFLTDYNSLQS